MQAAPEHATSARPSEPDAVSGVRRIPLGLRPGTTVCIDARYVRERPSGVGLLVEKLVERAPAFAPDVRFVLLKHPLRRGPLSSHPNVVERVVPWDANGPVTLLALPRFVDLRGVDLFHAPFNILPAGLSMPTVVTIHDLMWLRRPDLARKPGPWGAIETLFYANGIRRALARASAIVAPSRATLDDIAIVDPAARARSRVITPSVHERFRVLGDLPRLGLGLRPGKYILVVGQSAPYKNHETVVRAFAAAFCDTPDVRLVIVHRLGEGGGLEKLASHLGIRDRVTILGGVTVRALVALYNGAIALCHPSLWEGLGIPIVEAMACGCPVVTSRVSAMPETAGGAAVLAAPDRPNEIAAALRRVAADPRLASALRSRGLQRARGLPSWDDFAWEHVALYRDVIGANGADARAAVV